MTIPKLTREQAMIITVYTGIGCGVFGDVQDYAERKLGRPLMTHDFADPELWAALKEAARDDFLGLCADGKAEKPPLGPRREVAPDIILVTE